MKPFLHNTLDEEWFLFYGKMESLSWFMLKKKDFNISRVKVGQMGKVPGSMWKWVHYFTVNQLFLGARNIREISESIFVANISRRELVSAMWVL